MGKNKKGKQFDGLYNKAYDMNNDLQHMYSKAAKPEEVRVFFDEAEFIKTPGELIARCEDQENSVFKEKPRVCPYDETINIRDIQLNAHGPMED